MDRYRAARLDLLDRNRLAGFIGAPLGGVLIAIGGLRLVALADAVSFVFISVLLAFVLKPRLPRRLSTGHSIRADIAAGLRYIVHTKPVRTLVVALSGLNLFISPVLAVGVVLRVHDEGWSSTSLGLIEATVAISAAAASAAAVPWRPGRPARERTRSPSRVASAGSSVAAARPPTGSGVARRGWAAARRSPPG